MHVNFSPASDNNFCMIFSAPTKSPYKPLGFQLLLSPKANDTWFSLIFFLTPASSHFQLQILFQLYIAV